MGFFDRLSRLLRANLNQLVTNAEDPAKILDQSVIDMQVDLEKLRKAVATALVSQKRLSRQADQAQEQSQVWYQRAEQAIQKGEEDLAKQALIRRKTFQETFSSLSNQLEGQAGQVQMLQRSLISLEGKIAEARTKKDMLKARAQAAKAKQQLQTAVGAFGSDSSRAAFEKMEERIEEMEASGEVADELSGTDLEARFSSLEGSTDIEDELVQIKNSIAQNNNVISLPASDKESIIDSTKTSEFDIQAVDISEIDQDFEELKKKIEDEE